MKSVEIWTFLCKAGMAAGVVLSAALVLLLAAAACLLWLPIRYEAGAGVDSTQAAKTDLFVRLALPGRFLSLFLGFREGERRLQLWILHLPVGGRSGRKKQKETNHIPAAGPEGMEESGGTFKAAKDGQRFQDSQTGKGQKAKGSKDAQKGKPETKTSRNRKKKGRAGVIKKLRNLASRPEHREAGRKILFCVWELLRKIRPKKITGELFFSTQDPAVTGILLGMLGVWLPVHGNALQVRYSFREENKLQADVRAEGRFFLGSLCARLIRLLADRQVRLLWKAWKEER